MMVPLDVCEIGDEFIIRAVVPGVSPNSLNVTANENTITLTGEFNAPDWMQQAAAGAQGSTSSQPSQSTKQSICWLQEVPIGKFARTVTLPFPVDPARGQSTLDNGILTLRLPKSQAAMSKSIPVQTGAQSGNWGSTSGAR
jgi:HSP20 family protein